MLLAADEEAVGGSTEDDGPAEDNEAASSPGEGVAAAMEAIGRKMRGTLRRCEHVEDGLGSNLFLVR